MTFGREFRIDNLGRGLASNIGDADLPPGASLAEVNMTLHELGAIQKRGGIVRSIPQEFTGDVCAIIPIADCLGERWFIIASDDLRVAKK